jgi:hypothetical protein
MSGKKGIPASGEVSDKNSVSASVEEPDEKGISASGEAVDLSSDDNIGFDEYLKLVNAMFKNGYGIGIFIDADDTIQAVPIAWFKYFPNGNPIDPMGSKFGCWYPKETVKKPGDYIAKCPVVEGSAYESGFQLFAVKRLPKASECGASKCKLEHSISI